MKQSCAHIRRCSQWTIIVHQLWPEYLWQEKERTHLEMGQRDGSTGSRRHSRREKAVVGRIRKEELASECEIHVFLPIHICIRDLRITAHDTLPLNWPWVFASYVSHRLDLCSNIFHEVSMYVSMCVSEEQRHFRWKGRRKTGTNLICFLRGPKHKIPAFDCLVQNNVLFPLILLQLFLTFHAPVFTLIIPETSLFKIILLHPQSMCFRLAAQFFAFSQTLL